MQDMKQQNAWKPVSIVLAVLIFITIVGAVVLVMFQGTTKSTSSAENTINTTDLSAVSPSKDEMKLVSSITISSTKGSSKSEKEETTEAKNEEMEKESTPIESHRYEVINTRMTWSEAKAYCENLGGYLATVESQEEYNKVLELASASGRKVLWLGAQKNSNQTFEWITGETFGYSFWLSGEPNNEGGNENCLVMFQVNGQWVWADVPNDVSPYYGEDTVGFVCEYDE